MSRAFDMYEYAADSEHPKAKYDVVSGSNVETWPCQGLLSVKSLYEKDILVSKCLREDPEYYLASKEDARIKMIPLAHIEALYAWINKPDMDDVKRNPAFYHETIMEVEKRRHGHF